MHDHGAVNLWFVLARAGHFAACLLLAGVFAFDRLVATTAPMARTEWKGIATRLLLISFPVILLTGMWWLAMVTIEMSELPPKEALTPQVLGEVWNQTHFGAVWKLRLTLWCGAAVAALLWCRLSSLRMEGVRTGKPAPQMHGALLSWLALFLSGGLCASLAWAGHAQMNQWSLASDAIHLTTSAVWPAGLVPLSMMLWQLRRLGHWSAVAILINRFSLVSVVAVLVLIATGVVNSVYLVGSFRGLISSGYGLTLLAKIGLFFFATLLGAANLLYLRPRLSGDAGEAVKGTHSLQLTIAAEIALMAGVIVVVGVLGLLPPAGQ